MTSIQQRAALQRQIWQIANEVRGSVDGWDFEQYVLGTLFYRFISENFASYLEAEDPEGSQIDLFGDAYEFLIFNSAANAGKSGGEFFTPQHVSRLIAQLAMHKQTSVNKIYAAGSGSLLLQAKKHFDAHIIEEVFDTKENVPHFAALVDHATVAGKDYNLSVSTYVEAKDTREVVDIGQLNAELANTVAKIDRLRTDIHAIVAEIEGEEVVA